MKYYEFKPGIPAPKSKILSDDIRNNFEVLNKRTEHLLIKPTNPPSKKVVITGGCVYFSDNESVLLNDIILDLGSEENGISEFTTNEIGYFRDVFIYATIINENVSIKFIEGKSKIFNKPDFYAYTIPAGVIPIAHVLVRNNGIVNKKGCIEPITINNLYDLRSYVSTSAIKYYTTTVGDKRITIESFNNDTIIKDGYSSGEFNDIYKAIDYVNSLGGGTVFLRKGIYIIDRPLEIKGNIRIIGEGYHSILQIVDNFTIQSPAIILNGEDIRLEHLSIIGDSNVNNILYSIINLFNCKNCFISNIKLNTNNNSAYGIVLNGTKHCTIRDNIIKNAKVGIFLDQFSEFNIITHNHFDNITDNPAILIQGNNNIDTLNNNNIEGINEEKIGTEEIYIDNDLKLNDHRLIDVKAIKFNNFDGYFDTIIDKNIVYVKNNNLYFKDNNNNIFKINNINIVDNTLNVSNIISNRLSFSDVDYSTIIGGRLYSYINNQNILNYNSNNLNYIGKINAPSAEINNFKAQNIKTDTISVDKTYGIAIDSKSHINIDGYIYTNGVVLNNINNSRITLKNNNSNIGDIELLLNKPENNILSSILYDGYNNLFFSEDNIVWEFSNPGSYTFIPNYDFNAEIIIVGGGGGGSNNNQGGHGGGGGGVYIARCLLLKDVMYNIFVGDGGNELSDGENSYFIGGGYNFIAQGGRGATSSTPGQGGQGGGNGYNGGNGGFGITTPSIVNLSLCGHPSKENSGGVSILTLTSDGRISAIHGGGGGSYGCGGTYGGSVGIGGGGASMQKGGSGIVIIKKTQYL